MFVIWSGWGALTIFIVAAVTIVAGAIVQLLLGAVGYPQLAFFPLLALPGAIRG